MYKVWNIKKIKNIVEKIKNRIEEEEEEEIKKKWLEKFERDIADINFESLTSPEDVFGKIEYIKAVIEDHFNLILCWECGEIKTIKNALHIDNNTICEDCIPYTKK